MSDPTLPASAYESLGLPSDTVKILMNPKPNNPETPVAAPNLLQNKQRKNAEPLPPNASSITLYAELLLHIRTVTLFASLRTHHTRETKAQLSADGSSITVSHEGESATIVLPIKAKGGGDAALSLPAQPPSKELTLRLQIEEQEGSDLLGSLQSEERKLNIVPWGGASLKELHDIQVQCKSCQKVIVSSGTITEWRDLPNENWAEMMDFWHCHKPDEHHLHDHTHHDIVGRKGYAAGNRLKALKGLGFVDLSSFLIQEQDCQGVESSERASRPSLVLCDKCSHVLGAKDDSSEGVQIWKWCLSISSSSHPTTSYITSKWISARLLFLIENTGVRKFQVHPPCSSSSRDSNSVPSLLLWVFTPDLLFSSSITSPNRQDPTRCMKVFYQQQTWSPPQPGEPEPASIEEVEFSDDLFEEVRKALKESQNLLPATARQFQGWDVGLLERFDGSDISKKIVNFESSMTGQIIDTS